MTVYNTRIMERTSLQTMYSHVKLNTNEMQSNRHFNHHIMIYELPTDVITINMNNNNYTHTYIVQRVQRRYL